MNSRFVSNKPIKVIGCGLAGMEVAFILANYGFTVHIFDNGDNSAKHKKFDYYNPYEIFLTENMKYELECLGSPLFSIAKKENFDKFGFKYSEEFMNKVKSILLSKPNVKLFSGNIDTLNETETNIIATGHNTDKKLLKNLEDYIGNQRICYFNPENLVLNAEHIDLEKLNFVTETECYANVTLEEYEKLYNKIVKYNSQYQLPKEIANEKQITVESIARRGYGGLRNSVLRPHFDENTMSRTKTYASLKMTYNKSKNVLIVDNFFTAFDTEEQIDIFNSIEVLNGFEIEKPSVIRRKTYLLTPACVNENLQVIDHENIFVCGGLLGTNGSFESLLMADLCAYSVIEQLDHYIGTKYLKEDCCVGKIYENLFKKSVVNFRLFNLKYDII
ncbi:MAG: FAD-dependent oxidoreductase, partial [Clostridia bacterium]|nr:FAD-dependent oxidoreductase [Clostridia bacterium]